VFQDAHEEILSIFDTLAAQQTVRANKKLLEEYEINLNRWIISCVNLQKRLIESINKIRKIEAFPSKSTQKYIKITNRMILNIDQDLKMILNYLSKTAAINAEKRLDDLDGSTDLNDVYDLYAAVYESILSGLNLAINILPKISQLVSSVKNCQKINRENLMAAELNRWFLNGSENEKIFK